MADKTGIEWTEATWNPVVGCSIASAGCANCYAMRMAARLESMGGKVAEKYRGLTRATKAGPVWTGTVRLERAALDQPLRWSRGRRIFVNSMSDLFHEALADEEIAEVFAVMALTPRHRFQVLTKRAERMRALLCSRDFRRLIGRLTEQAAEENPRRYPHLRWEGEEGDEKVYPWPLSNLWVGVTVENQAAADERIPHLLAAPAAVRFLSCEPLVGRVDLSSRWFGPQNEGQWLNVVECGHPRNQYGLNWVIAGGESGRDARPVNPQWIRAIRDQCVAAGVPFMFKQWGAWSPRGRHYFAPFGSRLESGWRGMTGDHYFPAGKADDYGGGMCEVLTPSGKKDAGRTLDGEVWDQYPAGVAP